MDARWNLIQIFREARTLLAAPGNDFRRAPGWETQAKALGEVDAIVAALRDGDPDPDRMMLIFAPAGGLQAVGLASGWPDQFVDLAERFEQAAERFERQPRLRVVGGARG